MTKTIRLLYPDWQAGAKPEYYLGSQLLAWLAPKNNQQKEITVPVAKPTAIAALTSENGVVAQSTVKANALAAQKILREEQPDRIITFGGNCLVSQAPFDYLHGQYGDDLGVIWLDAHPDISTPQIFNHEHAMVLGNLLGAGDPELATTVTQPFNAADILYVGLQQPTEDEVAILQELQLTYTLQDNAAVNAEEIQAWVAQHHFKKLAIHFDLDVLSPELFEGLYFTEPGVTDYGAVAGKLAPTKAFKLLKQLLAENDVVGLTIAEYLPWSAAKLQQLFKELTIFKAE
ncbi:arginase family protein [Agrilactobacillus yilanensis]|uniref:Arginase family protein n=1 Tax=Agrilactobacillus yilanensis TaxID=2485997 RepID=A0ABW4J426_9LACO|nr:arginase family protein [Agrilactobacillus yilanensis]